jgi:hypothetical protein
MLKIELGNWWGKRSVHVKESTLTQLQKSIQNKLIKLKCTIDTSRPPHIEVTDLSKPNDQESYDSINNTTVNPLLESNWDIRRDCILLKFGKTKSGKQTHFTIAYTRDLKNISKKDVLNIISESLKEHKFSPTW